MKKLLVASATALSLFAASAKAGDAPVRWDGFYAGVFGSKIWMNDQVSSVILGNENFKIDGTVAGVLAGVNFQRGNWVGGFEASIGKGWASNTVPYGGGFDVTTKLDWSAHARARAGYAIDRTLFFLAGGVAFAKFEEQFFGIGTQQQRFFGLTGGGGVEAMIAPNWIFRTEYLYTYYQPEHSKYSTIFLPLQLSHWVDTHEARVALLYKFGDAPNTPATSVSYSRPVAGSEWTGAYVGAHGGYASIKDRVEFPDFFDGSTNIRGFVGGGLAGANLQRGNWVVGAEIDFGLTTTGREEVAPGLNSELVWDAHIRARLGHSFGNYMLYVAGGLAIAQFQHFIVGFQEGPSATHIGYTLGGGIDMMIAPYWVLRGEYIYSDYGRATNFHQVFPLSLNSTPQSHVIRGALIYNFGNPGGDDVSASRRISNKYNWSGYYAGVYGGAQQLRSVIDAIAFGNDQFETGGWSAGGLAGFNYQRGNYVFGFEADAGKLFSTDGATEDLFGPGVVNMRANWESHIRGRFGYAMGNYMLFGAAGVAAANFNLATDIDGTRSVTHLGFTLGAGVDTMLAENWLLRFEYLYSNYTANTYNYTSAILAGGLIDARFTTHSGRIATIYKFN